MNFIRICQLFDYVSSIPIKTKKQRQRALEILQGVGKPWVLRCFRGSPGYLIVAWRSPRLEDYF